LLAITSSTIASIATGSAICHFKPNYTSNNEKAPTQVQEHEKCNTDGIYRDFQYIFFFSFFTSMSLAKPNDNEYILEKNTSLDA
jgi:hypothetical protein